MSTDAKTLELISRIKHDDEGAFRTLIDMYASLIESAAGSTSRYVESCGLASESDIAEDMRQEARLALYRAAVSYDPEGDGQYVTFGLYAKICIRNALTSEYRRIAAKKRRLDRLVRDTLERTTVPEDDKTVLSEIGLGKLLRDDDKLLSEYELEVLENYAEGKKIPTIAKDLGKSIRSVNNALYRIRAKLRR